jgi:tRNA(fMet)-specific endonuclease VapC
MKYLLDTCTVSDFVKGQANVLARVKATPPNLIAVSALTRMEVDYGLALNAERARKLAPLHIIFLLPRLLNFGQSRVLQ